VSRGSSSRQDRARDKIARRRSVVFFLHVQGARDETPRCKKQQRRHKSRSNDRKITGTARMRARARARPQPINPRDSSGHYRRCCDSRRSSVTQDCPGNRGPIEGGREGVGLPRESESPIAAAAASSAGIPRAKRRPAKDRSFERSEKSKARNVDPSSRREFPGDVRYSSGYKSCVIRSR